VHCLTGSGSCRCCLFWISSDDRRRRSQDLNFLRFRSAVQDAKIGPDKDIPHVAREVIVRYAADLHLLGLL
jgi:hypothetical protein